MLASHRRNKHQFLLISIFICLFIYLAAQCDRNSVWDLGAANPATSNPSNTLQQLPNNLELVIASTTSENISWFHEYLSDITTNIYVTDDPKAVPRIPVNKGHETMPYFTYIIDHYDNLPNITIFLHSQRFQWHNDNQDFDGLQMLQNIRLSYIQEIGYANLRCAWAVGCPAEIRPAADEKTTWEGDMMAKYIFAQAWRELFPDRQAPEIVGASCCGQFAVTRDSIRRHPKQDYERWRQWLINTSLDDRTSGTVLEYLWHIIFGKDAVDCPSAAQCYCNLYGLCDLDCTSEGDCPDRYQLPPYSTLPQGWPLVGWDGNPRDFSGPL
ncbi:hypothetical protein F4677DRAFT_410501 [Hypoxylon crocopeplum]|nr:hypothetical protein F4677DRAFT_410501 [Hypoxylon crocopeplum]